MSCRYECTCFLTVFWCVSVEKIVMSSAYVTSFILLFGGVRMSDVYTLDTLGESTPSCRTPVFILACFDFVSYSVNCLHLRM